DNGDHFALDLDLLPLDFRRYLAVGFGRDTHDLGETEVSGAELFEVVDEFVDALFGESDMLEAEVLPAQVGGLVSAGVADLLQALRLSDEGVVGDHAEGLSPADPRSEV